MLARALQAGGRRVAILSRGYKSVPRPLLLRVWDAHLQDKSRCSHRGWYPTEIRCCWIRERPGTSRSCWPTICAVSSCSWIADRVTSGQYAIEHFGADTLLLDDGFQYVRMRHGIEVVLIDNQAPFGNEFLLPRGTLREPPGNLRRATHIFLTKCVGSRTTPR